MRTKFFFFTMLISIVASAQTTVQITPVSATYTNTPTIQFKVSWTSQSTDNHRNKVWVFIDFQPVISPIQKGNWQPATITTGTVQKTAGTLSEQNNRGFFMEGTTTNFSSTVTVQLSNTGAAPFNWCAYASDYPPNATMANGTYTLKGSPPFKITYNGNSYLETSGKSFTLGCMASITDATGCPGIIDYPTLSAGALGNGSWGSMGEFLNVGGTPLAIVSATAATSSAGVRYKWYKNNVEISGATATTYLPPKTDAAAAGTFNYTRKAYDGVCHTAGTTASGTWTNVVGGPIHSFTGCSIYVAMYNITQKLSWTDADNACKSLGTGWRLPTMSEGINCLGPYRIELNLLAQTGENYATYTESTEVIPTQGSTACIGLASHMFLAVANHDMLEWHNGSECNMQWCNLHTWGHCGSMVDYTRCVKDK